MRGVMLRKLRRLQWVPRWVVVPTIKKQSVAEHSFSVVTISLWLAKFHARGEDPEFLIKVVRHAMEHDSEEAVTGDIPSPVKQDNYGSQHDYVCLVRVADKLEAILFCWEEATMGNEWHMAECLKSNTAEAAERFTLIAPDVSLVSFGQMMSCFSSEMHPKMNKHPITEALSAPGR